MLPLLGLQRAWVGDGRKLLYDLYTASFLHHTLKQNRSNTSKESCGGCLEITMKPDTRLIFVSFDKNCRE